MGKPTDGLREWARLLCNPEIQGAALKLADQIDREHKQRMEQCRRGVRKDFARYLRSCIADYERGNARRNRNHAHRVVTITTYSDGMELTHHTCSRCEASLVSEYDRYCSMCGAKLTGTDYVEAGK